MFQAKTEAAIDPIQLLNMRAQEVEKIRKIKVQYAGMGKPNAPINYNICLAGLTYWQEILEKTNIQGLLGRMRDNKKWGSFGKLEDPILTEEIDSIFTKFDEFKTPGSPRTLAAAGFNRFYNLDLDEAIIKPEHILFPLGGCGGLRALFEVFQGTIVLKRPFYPLYEGLNSTNTVLTYDEILEKKTHVSFGTVIDKLIRQKQKRSLILFCNPDNPTGKVISKNEWEYIIQKLKPLIEQDEECYIGVDEAYIELNFSDKPSLLEFIAEKLAQIKIGQGGGLETEAFYQRLLDRIVLLRSGTKALSGSGLRMAAMIVFNEILRQKLKHKTQELGSSPAHLKLAYATAVSHFNTRIKGGQLHFLREFYLTQVRHAEKRAEELGIAIKNDDDECEPVDGTFYICINLRCLIDLQVKEQDIQAQLVKWGLNDTVLKTDLDIAYYLLLKVGVMLAPLSIFGGIAEEGILRMTCSEGIAFLDKIFDKLKGLIKKMPSQSVFSMRQLGNSLAGSSGESPLMSPLMSPVIPGSPLPERASSRLEKSILPPQIFADYMCQFWEKISSGAKKVEILRDESFKASVKPYFKEALLWALHILLKTTGEDTVLNQMAAKLYLDKLGALEALLLKYVDDFKPQAEIYGFCYDEICEKVFAEIFADIQKNGEQAPFYHACFEIYAKLPKTVLIQQIVNLKSAVDYTHPQGKANCTAIMSRNLNTWYRREISSSESLLFFSIEWTAFINNIFRHTPEETRVINWEGFETEAKINAMSETKKPVAISFCVFGEEIGASFEVRQLKKTAEIFKKILKKRPNFYLVVNEAYVERCPKTHVEFGKNSIISHLLEQDLSLKKRLLIIRSAVGIFTTENEKISVLIIPDEVIMAEATATSVKGQGNAPADLQLAYSCAFSDWIEGLYRLEYQRSSVQYVSALCQYHERKKSSENEMQNDPLYPKMSIEYLPNTELILSREGQAIRTASAPSVLNLGSRIIRSEQPISFAFSRVCKFLA